MSKQCDGQMYLHFDEKLEKINKDTATPVNVFCLCHYLDTQYINLLNDSIDKTRVKFVNSNKTIISSLHSSGKILDKIDYFVVLLSENILLNYNLLSILMLNYEISERVIIIVSDDKLYDAECKLNIYTNWTNSIKKYKNAINNDVINEDVLNTLNILVKAHDELSSYLKHLCAPITGYSFNVVDEFCDCFEQRNIKNLRRKQTDTKITPISKYNKQKIAGKNSMNNNFKNSNESVKIENHGTMQITLGDYSGIDSNYSIKQNDLDLDEIKNKLNFLINSAKNDLSELNKNDADKILFILEDILTAVENKNKVRLSTYIGSLSSAISICTNVPKLFSNLETIIETVNSFLS